MTKPTRVDFASSGGLTVAAYRWDPEGNRTPSRSWPTASASTPSATRHSPRR